MSVGGARIRVVRFHEQAWWEGREAIRNGRAVPARFTRAREPIPVRARLVWETSGVQVIDTHATAWTRTLVLVRIDDARSQTRGVWLDADDVRRRPPDTPAL